MPLSFEKSSYADEAKYKEWKKKQRLSERKRVRQYIESLKQDCFFCGSSENIVFHHVNAIEKTIDVTCCKSKKSATIEAEKCWCLCSECHTKLHQRLCDPLPSTYDTRLSVPRPI